MLGLSPASYQAHKLPQHSGSSVQLVMHEDAYGMLCTGDILAAQYEASEKADAELSAVQKRVQARASYMGVVGKVSRRLTQRPPAAGLAQCLTLCSCNVCVANGWKDGQPWL